MEAIKEEKKGKRGKKHQAGERVKPTNQKRNETYDTGM